MNDWPLLLPILQAVAPPLDALLDLISKQGASVGVVVYLIWRMEQRLTRLETMLDEVKARQRPTVRRSGKRAANPSGHVRPQSSH